MFTAIAGKSIFGIANACILVDVLDIAELLDLSLLGAGVLEHAAASAYWFLPRFLSHLRAL